jgi:hypothetical protein
MAEDVLRTAIDSISRRLHDELETQLALLRSQHLEEVEAARRSAEAEAEQRWSAKVEDVRAEWTARLESEVAAARSEAERRMVAESMRLRVEAEQAAAESVTRVRQELDEALNQERQRAEAELTSHREEAAAERERLENEVRELRAQVESFSQEVDSLKQQADSLSREADSLKQEADTLRQEADTARQEADSLAEARRQAETALDDERRAREAEARQREESAAAAAEERVAERQAQLAVVERLLGAIRSLDTARSLTQVLSALLTSAAAEAPRVALFVMSGRELKAWKAEGFGVDAASLHVDAAEDGLLAEVLRRAEPVASTSDTSGPAAPAFAQLPADRAALAVPLLVGGQPVALLYADDAAEREAEAPASWPEAIQILCRHASVNLAHLTAARAAEAMRRSLVPPAASGGTAETRSAAPPEDGNSARRYARLLVSEIKLYNEAAVRVGRQQRDLLVRLKPEIDRARRLYEQRFSSEVDSRGALFQQELVQTLADGDPALLGGSA